MARRLRIFVLTGLLVAAGAIYAFLTDDGPASYTLQPVAELKPPRAFEITLIGGTAVDPAQWTASFYFADPDARCSATLVGPRVILTAAHCFKNGARRIVIQQAKPPEKVSGTCTLYDSWPAERSADYALCLLDDPLPNVVYETVNTDPSVLKPRQKLFLTGYGCTKKGEEIKDDIFRFGQAEIFSLPLLGSDQISVTGTAVACLGDSGSGAFLLLDGTEDGRRRQVAINMLSTEIRFTYLASLSTARPIAFLKQWSAAHNVKICGLHTSALNCHK